MKTEKLVGVRFNSGGAMYTYKISSRIKLYLGQLLIVNSQGALTVVWVVNIRPSMPKGHVMSTLASIYGVVKEL